MGKSNNSPAAEITNTQTTDRDVAPLPEITAENANKVKTAEPLYTSAELAAVARAKFGTSPEVVAVALKTANKEKVTQGEAAAIIKTFLERKVK